jgi:hypothetical protein
VQHQLHLWREFSKCFDRWRQYLHRWNRNIANVQLAILAASMS